MKKILKTILFSLSIVFLVISTYKNHIYALDIQANSDISEETGKIIIPFTKNWENVSEEELPDSISIKLYKYSDDTFDESTAILVKEAIVSKDTNWKYDFDISNETIVDSSNNTYKFKVVEEMIDGYEEITDLHVDPNVVFTLPSVDNKWNIINPCSSINITTNGNFKTIIVAKMTGNQDNRFVVWTIEPLSETERRLVYESVRPINGFGNPSYAAFVFISGTNGEYYYNGQKIISVDENHIYFEGGTKVWSKFATGFYYKSSTEANESSITNTIKKTSLLVEKKWNDHNNILGLRPDSITIQLLKNNEVIEEVELSQNTSWKYEFTNLVEYTDGIKNEYTINEITVKGYKTSQIVNGSTITITNTHEVKSTQVSVKKEWENTDQISQLPGVIVGLYYKKSEDGALTKIAQATLSQTNNWSYTFTSGDGKFDILPDDYIYVVKEIGFDIDESEKSFYEEYFNTKYTHKGNDWTITNTCTITYVLPETGSMKSIVILIISTFLIGMSSIYLVYSFIRKDI
ncbi:MAG: Cna B-type domain-containing protein [bacterium]|nr:Cna B-type domain-containing protein [bacterium]